MFVCSQGSVIDSDLQGVVEPPSMPHSHQKSRLDAHAQKLHQEVPGSSSAASHPLASLLAELPYQSHQLQVTPPQPPKVTPPLPPLAPLLVLLQLSHTPVMVCAHLHQTKANRSIKCFGVTSRGVPVNIICTFTLSS